MTDDRTVLQMLGRIEGKLDGALTQLAGHDADIDELRRDVAKVREDVTSLRTTHRVAWGAIGFLTVVLGIVAEIGWPSR